MRTTGDPTWVAFWEPVPSATVSFLLGLFPEWSCEAAPAYSTLLRLGDAAVCGVEPKVYEYAQATVYFAASDVAAAARRAVELGARILPIGGEEIMDVGEAGDVGRVVVLIDPQGCLFGLWQAGTAKGFADPGAVGTAGWFDLYSPDPAGARDFYGALFDVTFTETVADFWAAHRAGEDRRLFCIGPKDGHDGWVSSFLVDDVDRRVALARELGGVPVTEPRDMPGGRWVVVRTPSGSQVGLYDLSD